MSRSITTTSSLLALLPLLTHASPVSPPVSHLSPRQSPATLYQSADGSGVVTVTLSDTKVDLGDQPPWWVIESIKENCDEIACDFSWTFDASSIDSVTLGHIVKPITVTAQSTYSVGQRDTLTQCLMDVSGVPGVYTVTTGQMCPDPCTGGRICEGTSCLSPLEPLDSYVTANRFSIRLEGDQTSFISVTLEEGPGPGEGFCEAVTGLGSAIAGALPGGGPAAGGLGVASILCGLFEGGE